MNIGAVGTAVSISVCFVWAIATALVGVQFEPHTRPATWAELAVRGVLGLSALWMLAFTGWMIYRETKKDE